MTFDASNAFDEWKQLEPERARAFCEALGEATAREEWIRKYEQGVGIERTRIVALVRLGMACGNLDLAQEAIETGASVEAMRERFLEAALEQPAESTDRYSMPSGNVARGGAFRHATTAALLKPRERNGVG